MHQKGWKLYPKNKDGFVDKLELYKIAYGKLKLPLDSLYNLTIEEFIAILNGHEESMLDYFNNHSLSVFYAIRSANNSKVKKFENPFSNGNEIKESSNKVTKEDYEKTIEIAKRMAEQEKRQKINQ